MHRIGSNLLPLGEREKQNKLKCCDDYGGAIDGNESCSCFGLVIVCPSIHSNNENVIEVEKKRSVQTASSTARWCAGPFFVCQPGDYLVRHSTPSSVP